MKSLWSEREAEQHQGDLAQAVSVAHLLGAETTVLQPAAACRSRSASRNVFGERVDVLCVASRECDLAALEAGDFARLQLERLTRLAKVKTLSEARLAQEVRVCLLGSEPWAIRPTCCCTR